jgi:hypothetical protein
MTRAAFGSETRPRSAQAVNAEKPTALIRCSLIPIYASILRGFPLKLTSGQFHDNYAH